MCVCVYVCACVCASPWLVYAAHQGRGSGRQFTPSFCMLRCQHCHSTTIEPDASQG